MPFYTCAPCCPVCPEEHVKTARWERIRAPKLVLSESNYSGCGVDIAYCPNCGHEFQVSYKVDEITDVTIEEPDGAVTHPQD